MMVPQPVSRSFSVGAGMNFHFYWREGGGDTIDKK